MKYIFRTNELCRMCFGVPIDEYVGYGMTPLLERILGEPSARRYLIAQDPIPGPNTGKGDVIIYTGEKAGSMKDIDESAYHVIGEIERVNE